MTTKMLDGSRWQAWTNPKISFKYGKEERGRPSPLVDGLQLLLDSNDGEEGDLD